MTDIGTNITVAMITRNEEGAIGKVVGDILAALPSAEIIIVDSSDDKTPEIAEQMGVTVIRQYPPEGYGPAMDKALRAGGRAVTVTLDCDDTYPVDRIEPMARMVLEDDFDLVDGNRLSRKPVAMPWLNYLANWGFAWMASVLFFRRIKDLHSGMRAYRAGLPAELNCPKRFAGFIRTLTTRVTSLSTMTPRQRVYFELLRISEPNAEGDGSWIINNIPSHSEIASWVGAEKGIVADAIGSLAREGVVARKHKSLVIKDHQRLVRLTDAR